MVLIASMSLVHGLPTLAVCRYKYKPFQVDISSKFTLLIKGVIEEAVRIGDKVLVFSQSIPGLDLLEMFLSRMEVRGWFPLQL